MAKLKDWIGKVHQVDRGLAALLRGLVTIERDDAARRLTLVWHAAFHKTAGGEREAGIRSYLGPYAEYDIEHLTLEEWGRQDPMLQEALDLGARVKAID